jgi:phosphotransferase system  glucose/maltose/N-acetylglucosamine-specific IIC component
MRKRADVSRRCILFSFFFSCPFIFCVCSFYVIFFVSLFCFLFCIIACFINGPSKTWESASFDPKVALLGGSIGELFRTFGVHSVLIWTAMLLKKRVVVVGETSEHVLNTIRVLPQLAWSRQNWSILRPLVTLNDNE